MKKRDVLLFASLVLFLFAGCRESAPSTVPRRPPLQPGAEAVAVHDRMPPDCMPGERITGRAASAESGEVVWKYALNDLRNQAAARRSSTVFMERYNHRTDRDLLIIEITGVLLNCAGADNPAPAAGGGDDLSPPPAGDDDVLSPPPAGDDDALSPPPAGR